LEELLTNYGPIDLLWCDQYSNGYTGARWPETLAYIRSLQPGCLVLANNSRNLSETDLFSYEASLGKDFFPPENNQTPAEVSDLSSTAGWFWHPGTDAALRPTGELASRLKACIARKANYLLNFAPEPSGQLPEASLKRMAELGKLMAGNSRSP
jgi:alpha-L-fucosidase